MVNSIEIIDNMIKAVNDEGRNLTKWELSFMESITEQFEKKNSLSDRQEEILAKIYETKVR